MGRGRVLAVDPGTRRVGLAVSDPAGVVATPLDVLPSEGAVRRIGEIAKEKGISEIVVGLPLKLDGSEGAAAALARKLASELEENLRVPVTLVDERLTTAAAGRAFDEAQVEERKRRPVVDKVAATLLLQGYLDGRKGS